MVRISIKRARMVASWTWNGPEELCGICHGELDGCAPEAQFPGDDSPVVWGQCSHAFHLSCIDQWCQKQHDTPTCPMCRREWEIAANSDQTTVATTGTAPSSSSVIQQEQDENQLFLITPPSVINHTNSQLYNESDDMIILSRIDRVTNNNANERMSSHAVNMMDNQIDD
jgi:anaphase-promoting complex subunit 11